MAETFTDAQIDRMIAAEHSQRGQAAAAGAATLPNVLTDDQVDALLSQEAQPRVKRQGFMISEYDDGSFGLGSVSGPIVRGFKNIMPAAAQYSPGTGDTAALDAAVGPAVEVASVLSPATLGRMATTQASWLWRDGAARGPGRIGTETGESIARQRAVSAADDVAAHADLGIRPFGPAFHQGPAASIGKQLTETYGIGAPLRNALDETYQNMGQAAGRIADDISPNATAETAGLSAQRGLDRFRNATIAELDPPDVRALGINPVAPMPRQTFMSQGAARNAADAAPEWQRLGGRTATTSRGVEVPAARPLSESMTTRTTAEMLDDAELARVIRAPAADTSVGARSEALYERAWRLVPGNMRTNDTANWGALATVNTANAIRAVERQVASDISGQRVINGRIADWFTNPQANMSLGTMREIRTEVGRALSNYNPQQQSLDRSQLRSIYGAISRDIEVGLETLANRAAIRSRPGNRNNADYVPERIAREAAGALYAFRVADRYFRTSMERMDRFSSVLQAQSPEAAARRLIAAAQSGNKGDIQQFRAAMAGLRPEERAEFGSMIVRSLGAPVPSARGAVQEAGFSAQSFVTNYNRMSQEARDLVFAPEHQRALDRLFRVANRIANVEALANTSRTATNTINMSGIAAAGAALTTGDVLTPMAIGAGGFGTAVLMSRPQYADWLTRYMILSASVRDGTDRAIGPLYRHVTGLQRMTESNPELRAAFAGVLADLQSRRERGEPGPDLSRFSPISSAEAAPAGGRVQGETQAGMELPDYGFGPMTERTQRGLPNPELRSSLPTVGEQHGIPSAESGRAAVEALPSLAYEMTGIPSLQRGAGDIQRGYQQGDPLRAAKGAGEMVLGAVPAASTVRGGRAALAAATATPGRTAATMAAPLVPMAAADVRDARAGGEEKVRAAVEADQTVQRHRARLEALRGAQQKILSTPIPKMTAASADAARERMAKPINDEIATLIGTPEQPGLIQQAENAAAQAYLSNAPFRERYPGRAEALLYGAGALAFGLPMINTMRHKWADRYVHGPAIERQAQRVEDAARGTTTEPGRLAKAMGAQPATTAPNKAAFETEREVLRNKIAAREERAGKADWKQNVLPSAAMIAEARMLPEEIDALSYPPGHPARVAAEEKLTSLGYYTGAVAPSVFGGGAAAYYGNKVGGMASPAAMATPRGEAAASMRFKGERAQPDAPGSIDRIREAMTQRVETWLRPSAAGNAGSPQSLPSGSPAPLPGPQSRPYTDSLPSPTQGSAPYPKGLPPPSRDGSSPNPQDGAQSRAPSVPAAEQNQAKRPSKPPPRYRDGHKDIASSVVERHVSAGKTPTASQLRDELVDAYKGADLSMPNPSDLTKRVKAVHDLLVATEKMSVTNRMTEIRRVMGKPGYLAIPVAAGAAAAGRDEGEQ